MPPRGPLPKVICLTGLWMWLRPKFIFSQTPDLKTKDGVIEARRGYARPTSHLKSNINTRRHKGGIDVQRRAASGSTNEETSPISTGNHFFCRFIRLPTLPTQVRLSCILEILKETPRRACPYRRRLEHEAASG